jgi:hypothetical protein
LDPSGPARNSNGGVSHGYREACRRRRKLQRKCAYPFEVHEQGEAAQAVVSLALQWKADWVAERRLISRVGTDTA